MNLLSQILDLQYTDDLSYIRTHFDPLHKDDHYYQNLYHGSHVNNILLSDEAVQETSSTLSDQRHLTYEISDTKFHHQKSDLLTDISDDNKKFLQRCKQKFRSNEVSSNVYLTDLDHCSNFNHQEETRSRLFTEYSFGYDQICSRCICVSSILRNLSFISGNDIELVKYTTLIDLLARLLLLEHGLNRNNGTTFVSNKQAKHSLNDQTINDCLTKVI